MKYRAGSILFLGAVIAGTMSFMKSPGLADRMPMHWNISGQVDRYGSKWEALLFVPIFMVFLAIVFGVIGLVVSHRLRENTVKAMNVIAVATGVLMVIVHHALLSNDPQRIPQMMPVYLSGLLIVMGFAIRGVEPNPFVGIRVPWTMNSPETWRKTHDRASRLWIFAGAIGLVLGLIGAPLFMTISIFAVGIMYPLFDSYLISKSS